MSRSSPGPAPRGLLWGLVAAAVLLLAAAIGLSVVWLLVLPY